MNTGRSQECPACGHRQYDAEVWVIQKGRIQHKDITYLGRHDPINGSVGAYNWVLDNLLPSTSNPVYVRYVYECKRCAYYQVKGERVMTNDYTP